MASFRPPHRLRATAGDANGSHADIGTVRRQSAGAPRAGLRCRAAIFALCVGLGCGIGRAAADPTAIETVTITGERIAADDLKSASPITVIGADTLAMSSSTTLEQMFQTIPSMGYQGVGSSSSGGFGVYFVDLRSLNFNRTLTLVDGDRFVVSGIKTDEAVDLNNIPIALIDHIEILRSGSEPQFGADAVAGVVNVVLKKHFDGLAVTGYGGVTNNGDDTTGELTATWGRDFARGNLTLNTGYFQREPIAQSSRDWAREPVTFAELGDGGRITEIIGSPATPGGHAISSDGSIDSEVLGPGQSKPFDSQIDSYNFANAQFLQGRLKRVAANLIGYFQPTESMTASLEVLFIPEHERRPAFLIVDEAASYFDSNIDDLLTEARKYKVGCVFAHQFLDQCTSSLRASLAANTSIKMVSGVSMQDARALAPDMRTTPDFILSQPRLHFAAHIRNVTPQAVSIPVRLGALKREPELSRDAYERLRELNRDRVSLPLSSTRTASPTQENDIAHSDIEREDGHDPTAPSTEW